MPIVIPTLSTPVTPGTLDPGYYQKPFPSPAVSVPALTNYQFWFNGLTMGPGTNLEILKLEGLDLPNMRTGDAGRPRDRGRFVGADFLDGRDITITAQLAATPTTSFATGWGQVAAATAPTPGGTIESPLYLNLPGFGTLVTQARVRKRNMPIDITFALGNLANVTLMFSSSDPCWYSTPTLNPSVSPPGTSAGFAFPLSFPLSFGGGGVAGSLSVTNNGDIDVRPLLVITGPCTNPSVTLASTGANLTFGLTMNTGDQLVIDTDMHTATFFTSGSTIGSTRLYTLVQGSQWFSLPPGASTLQFLTGDPTASGTLTVEYASAYVI